MHDAILAILDDKGHATFLDKTDNTSLQHTLSANCS
jgi:hypothetical protein